MSSAKPAERAVHLSEPRKGNERLLHESVLDHILGDYLSLLFLTDRGGVLAPRTPAIAFLCILHRIPITARQLGPLITLDWDHRRLPTTIPRHSHLRRDNLSDALYALSSRSFRKLNLVGSKLYFIVFSHFTSDVTLCLVDMPKLIADR